MQLIVEYEIRRETCHEIVTRVSHRGNYLIATLESFYLHDTGILAQCACHSRQNVAFITLDVNFYSKPTAAQRKQVIQPNDPDFVARGIGVIAGN